jgi:hypothetical protein
MRITIEGTEEEIARVMRKLGETRETATPEPQPFVPHVPFVTLPYTIPPTRTTGIETHPDLGTHVTWEIMPTQLRGAETRSSMVDSDGCRHFFTERN